MKITLKIIVSLTFLFSSFTIQAQEYFFEVVEWEEAEKEIYEMFQRSQLNFCDTTDLPDFELFEEGDFRFNERLLLEESQYNKIMYRMRRRVIDKSDQIWQGSSSDLNEMITLKIVSKEGSESNQPGFFSDLTKDCGGVINWAFEVSLGIKVLGTVDFFYSDVKLGYASPIITFSPKQMRTLLEKEGIVF